MADTKPDAAPVDEVPSPVLVREELELPDGRYLIVYRYSDA